MFKSQAQRERCRQLVSEGKMTQQEFDRHEKDSEAVKLPERVRIKQIKIPKVRVIK